jgi:hypothetical protein
LTRKGILGLVVFLIALLIVASTVAALYYSDYTSTSSLNSANEQQLKVLEGEYQNLTDSYNSLAQRFNLFGQNYSELLQEYNTSLSLLAASLGEMNTSSQAYIQASMELNSLWRAYQELASVSLPQLSNVTLMLPTTHILVNFENGTAIWYNETVQPGWTLYIATLSATNGSLQATWYPQYGEHFVTGLLGVTSTDTQYWFLWVYSSNDTWQVAQVGADDLPAVNGSTYAWTYCTANAQFAPNCTP